MKPTLFFLLFPTALMATELIPIPGENWGVSFSEPTPAQFQGQMKKNDFQYKSISENGLMITLFVEEPAKKGNVSHQDIGDYYWSKASENPMIDPKSVKTTKVETWQKVEYNIKYDDGKKVHIFRNVNYYFLKNGKWVDLHISATQGKKQAQQKILTLFETNLKIVDLK